MVIGSGAAGLNAAVQLRNQGIDYVLIVSEGLKMGTSINTGSDKQTYYKTAMCGHDLDAPLAMAKNFFSPGSMHGDLALSEAAVSLIRHLPQSSRLHDRLKRKYGKGKALSILAHKLGRTVYFMLKRNQAFDADRFLANA